ncbi:uncharacterized transporter C405.03c-like [Juglans microcarpa x Juglans regia]|uniref:uncharacterized transporter C405.03c-like n=1 Tax=Juglans microcarpa x Juglans regia TaxID=2249226 RepID=UPI001B7E5004|nr:uncharacterized transporter C405.03c-like [Juglans microcarpa x Juglans regia]
MGWRYGGGLLLITTVAIVWVTSAEITQGIFTEYKHPFAVTYLGTSLLAAYLPIAYIKDWLLKFLRISSCTSDHDPADDFSGGIESPIYNNCAQTDMDIEQQQPLADEKCVKGLDFQKLEKPTIFYSKYYEHDQDMLIHRRKLSTKEVATLGLFIGPIWFLSEYFMNAALERTSVASTTILFSTSGLFVILIESMMGQASVNVVNLVSVSVSMAGVVMTTYGKTWAENESQSNTSLDRNQSFLGYVFALLSAMTDGLFTVLLKKFAGEEGEKVDLQKLFGYIGLVILVSLWWLVLPLTALGIEPKFMVPDSAKMVEFLVANCFAGSFLSDYFWALGVVWTTPLVAALGASLTIPLAMLEDMVIHGRHYSIIYILGSLQVFLGFVIANLSDWFSPTLGLPLLNSLRNFLIHS